MKQIIDGIDSLNKALKTPALLLFTWILILYSIFAPEYILGALNVIFKLLPDGLQHYITSLSIELNEILYLYSTLAFFQAFAIIMIFICDMTNHNFSFAKSFFDFITICNVLFINISFLAIQLGYIEISIDLFDSNNIPEYITAFSLGIGSIVSILLFFGQFFHISKS